MIHLSFHSIGDTCLDRITTPNNNNGTSTDSMSMSDLTTVTMTTDAIDNGGVTSDNNPSSMLK